MHTFCPQCGTKHELAARKSGERFTCTCGAQIVAPKKPTPVWLIVLLVSLPLVCIIPGILAAIAVPNFIRYQGRAKQSECRAHLRALYTAEKSHYAEFEAYSTSMDKVGFHPERGNRYAYFAAPFGPLEDRSAQSIRPEPESVGIGVDTYKHKGATQPSPPQRVAGSLPLGLSGECPRCELTAACAGNLDSDGDLDVWSISTAERTGPEGELIPAGTPFHDIDDL